MADAEPQIDMGTPLKGAVSSIYKDAWKSADKFDKETDAGIKKMDSEKAPSPPEMIEAPKSENYHSDPMQTFGSPIMWLAMFGSLLTKQPLDAALNSGAAVFNARNSQDAAGFKSAMDKWKIDSENAFKMADYNQQLYKDIIGKDEAELRARAVSAKDNVMIHMADAKMQAQLYKDREKNVAKLGEAVKAQTYAETKMKEAADVGKSPAEQQEAYFKALGDVKGMTSGKGGSSEIPGAGIDWKNADPSTPVGKTGLTVGSVKQAVEGVYKTGSYTGADLGRGWNDAKKAVDNAMAVLHPDFDRAKASKDYQTSMSSSKSEASAIGRRAGTTEVGVGEFDQLIEPTRESIKKLDMGNFKDYNAFVAAKDSHLNDPDYIEALNRIQELQNAYTSVLVRGGQRSDAAQSLAEHTINTLFGTKGSDRALDTMADNTKRIMKGIDKAKEGSVGKNDPEEGDISYLKSHNDAGHKAKFDKKFGAGAADKALGN